MDNAKMVVETKNVIWKVIRTFEKYLLTKKGFALDGIDYQLIMLLPSESSYSEKYSWVLSSEFLDRISEVNFLKEIITLLKNEITEEEYRTIARINKYESNFPLVRGVQYMFPFRDSFLEIKQAAVNGYFVEHGIIYKSNLSKLYPLRDSILTTQKGTIIYGLIHSIDSNFMLSYYKKDIATNTTSLEDTNIYTISYDHIYTIQ